MTSPIIDDFAKYEQLRDNKSTPEQVYKIGKSDGLDGVTLIRMLRSVFGLSLTEAKAVTISGSDHGLNLDQLQQQLVPTVKQMHRIDKKLSGREKK